MKNFNKYLLNLSLLVGLNTFSSAYAQFQSLHQSPVVYNISSSLDAGGNIYYNKTNPLIGFKDQFSPVGITGCLIGYPEFRDQCQTINGGFAFSFDGYTNYQEFKVYIPTGTTFFGVSGYMPQSVQYGVAVKLGVPPVRTLPLTEAEYQAAKVAQNRTQDFGKLLAGEERIIVHDGGGAVSLSGIARLNPPLTTGQWLYFRVLTQNTSVAGLGAIYEVNRDQYRTAYNSLNFGIDGDPVDGGTVPTVPVLTDIALSPSTWKIGTNSGSITVTPVGTNNPPLPANCSSDSPLVSLSQPSDGQTAKFDVTGTVATETPVKITCGDKEETLTLQPADPNAAQILDNVPSADSAGNLVINFKLKRPDTELAAANQTNFWVAALVPKTGFPFSEDEWFFLTPNGWTWLTLPHPPSVAYQLNQTPRAETSFSILTGLPKTDFEYFNAELYFGYMGADGVFKNMGAIWKKN